jgi:hypothetical protein
MEALRERFLEEVSTRYIQTIADEAEMAGWNSATAIVRKKQLKLATEKFENKN